MKSVWSEQWGALWRLALPLVAVQAGNQVRSLVDTVIIGRVSAEALGGVGLANALFLAISVLGMGATMGLDPLIAQAHGAGDEPRARGLLWQGFWLSALLAPGLTLAAWYSPWLLTLVEIEPEVVRLAGDYLDVRAWEMFPLMVFYAARSYLQAIGRTRPLVWGIALSNVVNLGLTWLLVFGGGGLPAWLGALRGVPALGVTGSALATVFCMLLQLGLALWGVRALSGAQPVPRGPRRVDLLKTLSVGGPIGLQLFVEVGIFTLVGALAGTFGKVPLAAHNVALTLASLPFTAALGIGSAGAVLVGRAVGAGDAARARVAGWVSMGGAASWMSVSAALFWLAPGLLMSLMTDVPEVVRLGAPLLGVAAVFQLSDGFQAVGSGILRGAGDTRFSFVANVVGHYGVGLPVALVCAWPLGQGIFGLWWGLCAGLSAVALALALRFDRISRRGVRAL
jgi:MATE family multidrug resistance protein